MALLVVGYLLLVTFLYVVPAHEITKTEPCIVPMPDKSLPQDCSDIYKVGKRDSDVYLIRPIDNVIPFKVYCDFSRFEAWTVIMARYDGSVSFNRSWSCYKHGFGDRSGEYWLGLDHIYQMTNHRNYKLRVDYRFWTGGSLYSADYNIFRIDSELHKYKLEIGGFRTCASDRLSYHKNRYFSTYDKDNDSWGKNCAQTFLGGFWYGACHHASPTGAYQQACSSPHGGTICMSWGGKPTNIMILKVAPRD